MFPDRYFKAGLIAFLITHILYTLAFILLSSSQSIIPYIIFVAYSLWIYNKLNLDGKAIKSAVIVYILFISLMGSAAANFWLFTFTTKGLLILIAAVLFIISDSILAVNKFSKKFGMAELIILSTYFTAQTIFAFTLV